jgi:hypothetical protein
MSQNITSYFEDISISQRDVKGYNFEVRVDNVLRNIGIEYISNPLQNIALWKRHQGVGTDFKIPSWNWEIEAKYSDAKIFPSWIKRDYMPRFSKNSFKVTVHNKDMKLTNSSLELCFLYDIYLVEIGCLKYVLKAEIKARTKANKLIEANSTKNTTKNTSAQNNGTKNSGSKNVNSKDGIENDGARTEENTQSSTSNDNIDVEREQFLNETLSRYPSLKKNKIRSSKECLGRHRVLVCSLKIFRPRYLCPFRVLYLKRHQRFPSYIEKYGKIYVCKNPECTGEICKTLDLTCSFLVEIDKCPRMYRPKHFCLPLPKPKLADFQPNLTYYLNLSTSGDE